MRVIYQLIVALDALFYRPLFACAIAAFGLAGLTWMHSEPDNSRPFTTAIEAFSQAHVLGLAIPQFLLLVAVVLVMLSVAVRRKGADIE
jgi:hypothetical protein